MKEEEESESIYSFWELFLLLNFLRRFFRKKIKKRNQLSLFCTNFIIFLLLILSRLIVLLSSLMRVCVCVCIQLFGFVHSFFRYIFYNRVFGFFPDQVNI